MTFLCDVMDMEMVDMDHLADLSRIFGLVLSKFQFNFTSVAEILVAHPSNVPWVIDWAECQFVTQNVKMLTDLSVNHLRQCLPGQPASGRAPDLGARVIAPHQQQGIPESMITHDTNISKA